MKSPEVEETTDTLTTRDRLLRSARSLFIERGYERTSVQEIVDAAGVTKPVLYYYFENKEAIHRAIVRDAYDGMLPILSSAMPNPEVSAATQILAHAERMFAYFVANIDSARLIFRELYGGVRIQSDFSRTSYLSEYRKSFGRLVALGIERGEWAGPTDAMTDTLVGLIHSAMSAEVRLEPVWQPGWEGLKRCLELIILGWMHMPRGPSAAARS